MSILKPFVDINRDHFIGSASGCVELVQYGDFQCEHCATVYTTIKLLKAHLGQDLKFVFRHYPLLTLHNLALEAAVACEAAAFQGKFWEMHDMIFENQKFLVRNSFSGFAEAIALDSYSFENSCAHKKLIHKVISDFESGVKSGVDGTPTFFINGKRYNGFNDFESLYKTCRYSAKLAGMAS